MKLVIGRNGKGATQPHEHNHVWLWHMVIIIIVMILGKSIDFNKIKAAPQSQTHETQHKHQQPR